MMEREEGFKRLDVLARHLRSAVPGALFDLDHWAEGKGLDARSTAPGTMADLEECGAAACAFGHACMIPEFREAGLRLEWSGSAPGYDVLVPIFQGLDGLEAAMAFFGIDSWDAAWIFLPEYYEPGRRVDPAEVAERIEALLDRKFNRMEKTE